MVGRSLFRLTIVGAFLIAVTTASMTLSAASCSSLSTQAGRDRDIYVTYGSLEVTADALMNLWGDWVRAGNATPQLEAQVRGLFEEYQKAMAVLETSVRLYRAGTISWEILQSRFGTAVAAVEGLRAPVTRSTGRAVPKGAYRVK